MDVHSERQEIRRLLFPADLDRLSSFLRENKFEEVTYGNPVTQNIYINNNVFLLPSNITLKLRKYIKDPTPEVTILPDEKYFYDVKSGHMLENMYVKTRKRSEILGNAFVELLDAIDMKGLLNDNFHLSNEILASMQDISVYPVFATQYKRRHFVIPSDENIRLTIDKDICFYIFDNSLLTAHKISEESYIKVELKIYGTGETPYISISESFKRNCVIPTRSKKCSGFYYLSANHRESAPKITKDLSPKELEIKFNIENLDYGIVFLLVRSLFSSEEGKYRISEGYKWSDETGSIIRYFKKNGEVYRLVFADDVYGTDYKTPYIANSIAREEVSSKYRPIERGPDVKLSEKKSLGEFYRIKKKFWVVNVESDRVYHIVCDVCDCVKGSLSQLEIEYTGILKSRGELSSEEVVQNDISEISKIILSKKTLYRHLKPTRLTKSDWVSSL